MGSPSQWAGEGKKIENNNKREKETDINLPER